MRIPVKSVGKRRGGDDAVHGRTKTSIVNRGEYLRASEGIKQVNGRENRGRVAVGNGVENVPCVKKNGTLKKTV